ncbi:MAG TPA: tetratricopeptide repeat protein [Clostridiales bacterium]|nr:tetratricopeptide repeat protein [Clostridiales bacterium]HQP69142.1 tetratricopeptide repeat protein [Clostridiales bacterium]
MKILIFNKDKRQLDPFNERIKKTLDQIEQANQYEIVSDKEKLHQVIEYSNPEIVIIDEGYELGEKPYSPAKAFFRRNKILIFVITIFSILLPFIYFSYSYKADVLESKLNETRSEMDIYFDDMIEQALYSMSLKKYSDIDVILKFKIINLNPSKKYIVEALKSASKQFTKLQFLASSLREKRDYMDMIEESIKLDPDYYLAYVCKAVLGYSTYRDSIFLKDYKMAIDLEPDKSIIYSSRGLLYYNLQNYELAEVDYKKAIKLDPKNFYAYNNLGLMRFQQKKYRESLDLFNTSIKIDSTNWYGLNNRSLIHMLNFNWKLAEADINRAFNLDSINSMIIANRTYYKLQTTVLESSNTSYSNDALLNDINYAIKLDSTNYYAYKIKSDFYGLYLRDFDKSLQGLDFLINNLSSFLSNNEYAQLYQEKGALLVECGRYRLAIEEFYKALLINRESREIYFNIGDVYKEHLNNPDSAIYYYKKAINSNSKEISSKAYLNIANSYADIGSLDSSLYYCNLAIKWDNTNAWGYFSRALLMVSMTKYNEALLDYSNSIKFDKSENGRLYTIRALLLSKKLYKHSEAIEDFKKADKKITNPIDKAENLQYLAETYKELDELDSAKYYYKKAIDLNPSNYEILTEYNYLQGRNHDIKERKIFSVEKNELDLFTEGLKYYRKGKYDLSCEYLTEAILIDKSNPYFLFFRTLTYIKTGKIKYALEDFVSMKKSYDQVRNSRTYAEDISIIYSELNTLITEKTYYGYLLRSEIYKLENLNEKSLEDINRAKKYLESSLVDEFLLKLN